MVWMKVPYTNFHNLNQDWIIRKIKELESEYAGFVDSNTIKYADPIEWNITTQYEPNTIVRDTATDIIYLSKQPVPAGISVENTDYWLRVGDLSSSAHQIDEINARLDQDEADIANLSTEIDTLETTVTNQINAIELDIEEIKAYANIGNLRGKKVLCIGDSWADGTGSDATVGWPTYFANITGCTLYQIVQNGGGFAAVGNTNADYPSMNYANALEAYATAQDENVRNNVCLVIAQSGVNDALKTSVILSDLQAGMTSFNTKCQTYYPNAKIIFIPTYGTEKDWVLVGESTGKTKVDAWRFLYYNIPEWAHVHGINAPVEAAGWFYGLTTYAGSSEHHLNTTGYRTLGYMIAAYAAGWDGVVSTAPNQGITWNQDLNYSSQQLSIERRGQDVFMRGFIQLANSDNFSYGSTTIVTVGTQYTNNNAYYVPAMFWNSSYRGIAFLRVSANGAIDIRTGTQLTGVPAVYFNVGWKVAACPL